MLDYLLAGWAELRARRIRRLGICPGCDRQPCTCAYAKDPAWVTRALAELER